MAELRWTEGQEARRATLGSTPVVIGRGSDSQVVLVSPSAELIDRVLPMLEQQYIRRANPECTPRMFILGTNAQSRTSPTGRP